LATPEVRFATPDPQSMFSAPQTANAPLPPPPVFAAPAPAPKPANGTTPAATPLPPTPDALATAFDQPPPQPAPAAPPVSDLKVIQLYNSYLVVETTEGMLVIDQHALHERILFEQLKRRVLSGTLETQPLLFPEPVELTAEQAARTLEHAAALAELGLMV